MSYSSEKLLARDFGGKLIWKIDSKVIKNQVKSIFRIIFCNLTCRVCLDKLFAKKLCRIRSKFFSFSYNSFQEKVPFSSVCLFSAAFSYPCNGIQFFFILLLFLFLFSQFFLYSFSPSFECRSQRRSFPLISCGSVAKNIAQLTLGDVWKSPNFDFLNKLQQRIEKRRL